MKINPIISIACLALSTIAVFLILSALQRKSESISISVLDGTGLSGGAILNAAYALSSELPVEIGFRGVDGKPGSITAMSRKDISNRMGDWMSLELRGNEIRLNGEVLVEGELRSRLLSYAESARLSDSLTLILVAARDEATGVHLVNLLQLMWEAGISHLIPVFTTEDVKETAQARESPSSGFHKRSENDSKLPDTAQTMGAHLSLAAFTASDCLFYDRSSD